MRDARVAWLPRSFLNTFDGDVAASERVVDLPGARFSIDSPLTIMCHSSIGSLHLLVSLTWKPMTLEDPVRLSTASSAAIAAEENARRMLLLPVSSSG